MPLCALAAGKAVTVEEEDGETVGGGVLGREHLWGDGERGRGQGTGMERCQTGLPVGSEIRCYPKSAGRYATGTVLEKSCTARVVHAELATFTTELPTLRAAVGAQSWLHRCP